MAIMAILFEELAALYSTIEPLLAFFYFVVKHGEHPHLTTLQPNELVCIKHRAIAIEAGKVASKLVVLRMIQPKRKHLIQQLTFVLFSQLFKIYHNIYKLIDFLVDEETS